MGTVVLLLGVLSACIVHGTKGRAAAYTRCMRDNGIQLTEAIVRSDGTAKIGTFPPDTDAERLNAARGACRKHAPKSYTNRQDPRAKVNNRKQGVCLRKRGVPGGLRRALGSGYRFNPEWREAVILCGDAYTYLEPGHDGVGN
ncbi:hypothetical protein ABZ816_15010 [Actinosynnema sp. NPDC047251]|uniref:hypothetical protein n=1 Tax=Saccharothrix espanaensis TaxID=103731 RepID=UPI000304ADF5|nr:hypothetical protein [Saccharothrix espanaensis]